MKELSIFGFIGFKRMNRICDFWAAILWVYFKRIQQWGLITVPRVRILLFFKTWCSTKKNVTSHFHLFPSKNVSLKSDKSNISLLFRCVLQAWEWGFKWDFSFSFAGETLYSVNYNAICRRHWKPRWHVFGHVWMNLLSLVRWKSIWKRKNGNIYL